MIQDSLYTVCIENQKRITIIFKEKVREALFANCIYARFETRYMPGFLNLLLFQSLKR